MQLDWLGWAIFGLVPSVAWLLGRLFGKATGWRGYFFAGQRLGTGAVANTYFGANLTFTAIFMILSEEAYKRGLIVLCVPIFWFLGTLLFVISYGRLRPFFQNGTTLHQALGEAFHSTNLQRCASMWTILAFLGTVSLEFYGGIKLLQWAGLPLFTNVSLAMLLALVCSAFTATGGLRGLAWADGVLNVAAGLATGCLWYYTWHLPTELLPGRVGSTAPTLSSAENALFVLSMAMIFLPFQFCTLDSWQRCGAWEKRQQSPMWLLVFGALLSLCYTVPVFVGTAVRHSGAGAGTHPLKAFLDALQLQPFVAGIVLTGFASAILSTADELLNCCALSLLFDTFLIQPSATLSPAAESRLMASGRFYTVVFGIGAASLSLVGLRYDRQISDMALAVFSVQIVFAVPLAIVLFRRIWAPHLGAPAIAATMAAFVSAIALVVAGWLTGDRSLADGAPIGGAVLGSVTFAVWAAIVLRRDRRTSMQNA